MPVSQPPILKLRIVVVDVPRSGQPRYRRQTGEHGDGIRMSTLFDIVQNFMSDNRYSASIGVRRRERYVKFVQ